MKPSKVRVMLSEDGKPYSLEVDGYKTKSGVFAYHRALDRNDRPVERGSRFAWALTHVGTGFAILFRPTREKIRAIARALDKRAEDFSLDALADKSRKENALSILRDVIRDVEGDSGFTPRLR